MQVAAATGRIADKSTGRRHRPSCPKIRSNRSIRGSDVAGAPCLRPAL